MKYVLGTAAVIIAISAAAFLYVQNEDGKAAEAKAADTESASSDSDI